MAFRESLNNARGESQQIIAAFFDIRGFSRFSQTQDSAEVAAFISHVFRRLLDDYFDFCNFSKSTGDGLLITVPYDTPQSLRENASRIVRAAIRCVDEFPQICADNPIINLAHPQEVGFGISRGAACCIVSEGEIIDYSGHRLNLAARLMDLARPKGIILDGDFQVEILDDDLQDLFSPG